jgi:hypothetical protein
MLLIDHEYHGVELRRPLPEEIYEWLYNTYGRPTGTRWFMRGNNIYFANEKDHLMFLLKCS